MTRSRPAGSLLVERTPRGLFTRKYRCRGRASCSPSTVTFCVGKVDARAELIHNLAIDFDAAFENQLLTLAAAAVAGGG